MIRRTTQKDRYDLLESGAGAHHDKTSQTLLEKENNEHLSALYDRVSSMRSLAVDIGSEIRSQNKFIDELDHDVGGLRGTFKNTMGKIGEAMSLSQGSGICVLVVFMVIVFVILWRMIR